MPSGGIRTHNLSKRAAADPRLRPRGQLGPANDILETAEKDIAASLK